VLEPAIAAFNSARDGHDDPGVVKRHGKAVRAAVQAALAPTWDATWRSIELLRTLPVASSVEDRWLVDRKDFTYHAQRAATGDVRFRIKDTVKQSAMLVGRREGAQTDLEAHEIFDDPLVLAGAIADGQAFIGEVIKVDRPFVTLELSSHCVVPVGAELHWTEQPGKCTVEVSDVGSKAPFTVSLETKKGKTKYFPEVGHQAAYSTSGPNQFHGPGLPERVPWTHIGPVEDQPEPEVQE
jgi:hypothetical protein